MDSLLDREKAHNEPRKLKKRQYDFETYIKINLNQYQS